MSEASFGSGGVGSSDLVKVTVRLTSEELRQLEYQASVDRITVTDCIRRSLAIGQIAWDAQRRHARLMIQDPEGGLRPIEIPSARSE